MNHSKISVRYAKALFLLAEEERLIDKIKNDIVFVKMISETVDEFNLLIESPVVGSKQKKLAFEAIFEKSVDKITLDFIYLVVDNKRELFINDICRNFLDLVRKDKGIESASFITASQVDDVLLNEVKVLAENYFKTNIELFSEVDKKLIGGYVLRVGDKQFDASVESKLKKMKRELLETNFEKNK